MNNDNVIDSDLVLDSSSDKINIELINTNKFIVLCITSFGLYLIWWMYKSWKFFEEKEHLGINSVARAIFGIFFLYPLFERIQKFAHLNGYNKSYSSSLLFIGYLMFTLLSRLPDPFWLISLLSFICIIQPLQALNYAIENSNFYHGNYRKNFNTRQIVLIVVGSLFITLVMIGLSLTEQEISSY